MAHKVIETDGGRWEYFDSDAEMLEAWAKQKDRPVTDAAFWTSQPYNKEWPEIRAGFYVKTVKLCARIECHNMCEPGEWQCRSCQQMV